MTATDKRTHDRAFVRTFFTTPTAEQGEADPAKKLRSAIGLRGMAAPDVWVPDNEDATAPSMRDEGAENIAEVVAEGGADFPGGRWRSGASSRSPPRPALRSAS